MKVTIEFEADNEHYVREQANHALRAGEYVAVIEDVLNFLRQIDKYGLPEDWKDLDTEEVVMRIRSEVIDRTTEVNLY